MELPKGISDLPTFPNCKMPIKRMPHTSPQKCLGHEYYLDRKAKFSITKEKAHYYCRYCGQHLQLIV